MSDKLFCGACVGTEHSHAIWLPCDDLENPFRRRIINGGETWVPLDDAERALASAMSAFGQDPKGLEAKHDSPAREAGDAQ